MRRTFRLANVLVLSLLGTAGCGDLVGSAVLPPGTQSPNTYNTTAGAVGTYRGVRATLQGLQSFIAISGALTDEFTAPGLGSDPASIGAIGDAVDERVVGTSVGLKGDAYGGLQKIRGGAMEARGLLAAYAQSESPALRGEMYALEGYADVLLAELYCSGVPLSTVDFQGDFTYKPGASQSTVYGQAIALFDSALAISSDSPSVMALSSVAKGRALLDLGQYAEAAEAVSNVPMAVQYTVLLRNSAGPNSYFSGYVVANNEGMTGLPFSLGGDPRVSVLPVGTNPFGIALFTPGQYPPGADAPMVMASGVEARLIEAEAALNTEMTVHSNDTTWLTILNALRTSCTTDIDCPTPSPAGTGGYSGLPQLSDPGSDSARITLLFNERAYWLFATGHRQGDLRRLVRNYGKSDDTVYPTGPYFGGLGFYGSDVNVPIPTSEGINPLFHGCLDRGA